MPETTPRPWDPAARPTTEQLLDWLLIATREEQMELIGALQQASQTAHDCFQQNHKGQLEHWERMHRARIDASTLARATDDAARASLAWRFHAPHITDAAIAGLVGQQPIVKLPSEDGEVSAPARVATARRDGDGVAVTLELPAELAERVRALTAPTTYDAFSIGPKL